MKMTENEFILQDRLGVIRDTINKYGEEKFFLSFSGGKDSTVVHHLLDMALPGNKIPRVFSNTGIEYNDVVQFVKEIQDERFITIFPKKNVRQTLERVGYPFKSKLHSSRLGLWQKGYRPKGVMDYINGTGTFEGGKFGCPKMLQYQFSDDFKLKVSELCCYEFKKKPFKDYQKESGRTITITGMMREEGGMRGAIDCIVTHGNGEVVKFHPLAKVTHEWEAWFIEQYNIKLCRLYYPPFNFTRTGCKGCPYSLTLSQNLEVMRLYLPNELRQTEALWKPVYDEYRRIGYRLKKEEQTKLF